MGGENNLDIGVQVAYHADELLLPFYVQGGFRLIHEKHAMVTVAHQDSQQDDEHLLLTGRKLVGQKAFIILIEHDVVAFAIYLLAGIAEEAVYHILEFPFGKRKGGSHAALLLVTAKQFYHLVADVHLIVQIATLKQIKLPVQFRPDIGISHAGSKIAHDEWPVVTANYIVGNKCRLRIIEGYAYSVLFVTLHSTRRLLQIIDRTVQDGCLPHPVDARQDIDIGTQFSRNIIPMPQPVYLDTFDVIGLYFHGFSF